MYCIVSLPRAGSMAVYSWILESLSGKYPDYKECADILINLNNPRHFRNVVEIFENMYRSKKLFDIVSKKTKSQMDVLPVLEEHFLYSETLYDTISCLFPTPLTSIKVGNTYDVLYRFLNDHKYKTITLARRDIRQQFLSYIVATKSGTYHGNPETITAIRNKMEKINIPEKVIVMWFDWLCKLHLIKKVTDYTFYMEDYINEPVTVLKELNLPEIKDYSRVIQKTKDTNFDVKIKNLDEFNKNWDKYCSMYKDIL